jgi:hypothetical protein
MRNPAEAEDTALLEQGKLSPYLKTTAIYRCPTDRGVLINDRRVKNVRSYSMNSFMGGRPSGIGPIPASVGARFVPFFARDSDLERARSSDLWTLIDEDSRSISDGFFVTDPTARIWYNFPSIAANRHKLRYTLSFADGHADSWQLRDPRTLEVNRNETEQTGNSDLEKLARVSTIPN